MARTALPGRVLPIILVRAWILLPFRHMDIQKRPIVGFGSSKDYVQGSLGAFFDGQIRSFSAHVGLQPLLDVLHGFLGLREVLVLHRA